VSVEHGEIGVWPFALSRRFRNTYGLIGINDCEKHAGGLAGKGESALYKCFDEGPRFHDKSSSLHEA
jgi:hypothetical protein